jgi:hypothetical protein
MRLWSQSPQFTETVPSVVEHNFGQKPLQVGVLIRERPQSL